MKKRPSATEAANCGVEVGSAPGTEGRAWRGVVDVMVTLGRGAFFVGPPGLSRSPTVNGGPVLLESRLKTAGRSRDRAPLRIYPPTRLGRPPWKSAAMPS